MTTQEMVDLVKDRTKQPDTAKILRELRSAFRWSMNRVYLSEGGPDLLSVSGTEASIAADSRTIDLSQYVASDTILGFKALWLMLPTDTIFTPMINRDLTDPAFQYFDNTLQTDPVVASGHPVLFHIENFSQFRFSPAIPAGSTIRLDYFKYGSPPDPTTNPDPTTVGSDLTYLFHDAIVAKTCAHLFENLDDARTGAWETRARDFLNDAMFAAQKRVQGPVAHRGWGK